MKSGGWAALCSSGFLCIPISNVEKLGGLGPPPCPLCAEVSLSFRGQDGALGRLSWWSNESRRHRKCHSTSLRASTVSHIGRGCGVGGWRWAQRPQPRPIQEAPHLCVLCEVTGPGFPRPQAGGGLGSWAPGHTWAVPSFPSPNRHPLSLSDQPGGGQYWVSWPQCCQERLLECSVQTCTPTDLPVPLAQRCAIPVTCLTYLWVLHT